jgi:hypothetical protein
VSKAFILTTDSVLALIISTFIAVSVLSLASRFEDPLDNSHALEGTGRDFLASLEKNGTLERAMVSGSTTELSGAMDYLPASVCGNLQIYENDTSRLVMQVNRTGCVCSSELAVSYRSFLARSDSAQRELYARFGACFT